MNGRAGKGNPWLRRQAGAAAVEFALVCMVFLVLLIGIMEMGRLLFYWNAAAEATRWGARLAVVCDFNDSIIKDKMQAMLPLLKTTDIAVTYEPATCASDAATARASCQSVTVEIRPTVVVKTFIPTLAMSLTMPPFVTTLPRESMDSATEANPVCK
jgi:Flp pilus assembly protein TadG